MKKVTEGTLSVGADGATRKPYSHPKVKLHNFGPADIICESGCSRVECSAGQDACPTDDGCASYETPAEV